MNPKRHNALVTIVTNPQSDEPLELTLVNPNRAVYRGAPLAGVYLFATGGAGGYVYAVSEDAGLTLPPGLTLDTTTGVISGTPTTAGHYVFEASVQDSSSTEVVARFSLEISSALVVVAATPPDSEVATFELYEYQFIVRDLTGTTITSGYTYTGDLPAGLSLSDSGLLSGNAIAPDGTSYFTVTVTTGDDEISFPASMFTYPELWPDVVSPTPVPDAVLGQRYFYQLPITGGAPPYSIEVATDNLPPGITLSRTGALSGVPTGPSTGATSIYVRDRFRRANFINTVFTLGVVDPQAKLKVQVAGVDIGEAGPERVDFVAGANVSISGATDGAGKRTVVISAAGGGGADVPPASAILTAGGTGGAPIPVGATFDGWVGRSFDIAAWQIECSPSGSITLDVQQAPYGSVPPSVSLPGSSAYPAVAAGIKAQGDVTGWDSVALTRGSAVRVEVVANSGVKFFSLGLFE